VSGVKSTAGDLDAAELGHALEPYLNAIASAIKFHASFRRVLCFLPLIATSEKFVEACQGAGLAAAHISGVSSDRREILTRFARWEFDVLSNAMLLTEGFDDPGIDCIVVLRPTRSRPLYAQMCGRGTRIEQTKENLLLLDFLWMHERHSITRPAHLISKSDEEADAITKLAEEKSAAGASQEELDLDGLASETQSQREDALQTLLRDKASRKMKFISAEEFALGHHNMDVVEYEPLMKWESQPITEKQSKYLRRAKIDIDTVRGRGHASKLLNLVFGAQKLVLASPAQQHLMRRMGHPSPATATFVEARRFFAGMRR
jgi:superfamily II DNA or RNA helicase